VELDVEFTKNVAEREEINDKEKGPQD